MNNKNKMESMKILSYTEQVVTEREVIYSTNELIKYELVNVLGFTHLNKSKDLPDEHFYREGDDVSVGCDFRISQTSAATWQIEMRVEENGKWFTKYYGYIHSINYLYSLLMGVGMFPDYKQLSELQPIDNRLQDFIKERDYLLSLPKDHKELPSKEFVEEVIRRKPNHSDAPRGFYDDGADYWTMGQALDVGDDGELQWYKCRIDEAMEEYDLKEG